jgi:hypothetical protein
MEASGDFAKCMTIKNIVLVAMISIEKRSNFFQMGLFERIGVKLSNKCRIEMNATIANITINGSVIICLLLIYNLNINYFYFRH